MPPDGAAGLLRVAALALFASFALQLATGGLSVTSVLLWLSVCSSITLLGAALVLLLLLLSGERIPERRLMLWEVCGEPSTRLLRLLFRATVFVSSPPSEPVQTRRVVVSHSVDKALKEVFDYVYRDYILSWYAPLSRDEGRLYQMLSEDFWEVTKRLRNRLTEVDVVNMVCNDIVKGLHTHFCELKAADSKKNVTALPFPLHPCLRSPEEELQFLRCCSRMLLLRFLPVRDARSPSLRAVLIEVIAAKVLKPLVDTLSDPDCLNQALLAQLEYRELLSERHRKAYTYAPSYEEFIKLISSSSSIDFLKQLRYQIVVEIIQATTISSLPQMKKQKDGKGKETAAMKADLLRARNMKRYINQLTVAKKQCDKRIRLLGGARSEKQDEGPAEDDDGPQRILQFEEIMSNPSFRKYFRIYMERVDKRALISFWEQVEALWSASKSEVPQMVGEIYQDFFVESREIVVDKAIYKEIQQTLVGNKGTDVFHGIQAGVYESMKERYYPSFLVSDLYEQLMRREEQRASLRSGSQEKDENCQIAENEEEVLDEGSQGINEQASYAANKLQQLSDKLEYKRQALGSLQNAPKPDRKIVTKLKEEISVMEKEYGELQLHISRTDWWCENLSMWRAVIVGTEATEENGEQTACYVVSVSLQDVDESLDSCWSVTRKLSEFQSLHRKLSECFPSLKKVQLPTLSKLPFKSVDQKFLNKSKVQLNNFLQKMLLDDRMCQSEALYAFLSPSPEHLKVIDIQKKSSFSLASFLERLPGEFFSHQEGDDDDDSDLSDYGEETDGRKDSLAEPCFMLIGEIFELRGMFKWVRKTLIALVQVTFGRTINKQILDTVNCIFSEQMLVYYISAFRDAFWPNGKMTPHGKVRSESERRETRERAQQKLLENIPVALQNLVGQQNARYGIIRIFNALQEVNANKHLLYILLEMLLKELCPELRSEVEQA